MFCLVLPVLKETKRQKSMENCIWRFVSSALYHNIFFFDLASPRLCYLRRIRREPPDIAEILLKVALNTITLENVDPSIA